MMKNNNKNTLIGVDLGGTKVAAGRIDNNVLGAVIQRPTPAQSDDPQDIIDVIIDVIAELFDAQVVGIGIGIPSLVDKEKGIVFDVQNIPSWNRVHLADILNQRFGVPVYLDNDANCFALGEYRFGRGQGVEDFVGITLGTGMGGGIIKNGYLLPDASCGSGEFGNIPYLDSIYEDYCSGKFFTDKYNTKGEKLAEMAQKGDASAQKAFDEFGHHLGNAIKTIMLAVDPQKVIIGGSTAKSSSLFEKSMWKTINTFPFPIALNGFEVVFSDVKDIAVLGAASLYLDRHKLVRSEI